MIASLRSIDPTTITALPHGDELNAATDWAWEPTIVVGIALFVGLYHYAIGPLRRHHDERVSGKQIVLFLLGTSILFLSLVSPLDVLSDDYLFSAHMVQHLLVSTIVPLLWLLGMPSWLVSLVLQPLVLRRMARFITFPVTAFVLFNAVFWSWHWPALYDLAVAHEGVHAIQHLTFIAAGVVNWWAVLIAVPELPHLSNPVRVFYLFLSCQPGVALGALFVFSRDVLYQAYVDAPRLFELSPVADQQLGGLIMWIPGNAIYLVALSIIFLRWIREDELAEA